MSGKASRARRVEAVRRAREDAARAQDDSPFSALNPYTDPRQARIYASAYAHAVQQYRDIASVCVAYCGEIVPRGAP